MEMIDLPKNENDKGEKKGEEKNRKVGRDFHSKI